MAGRVHGDERRALGLEDLRGSGAARARAAPRRAARAAPRAAATTDKASASPFKEMRAGVKEAADETLLTPRFYTTDFDEMEQLFNTEFNSKLNEEEMKAMLSEFATDYNQTHFVRDPSFKEAADKVSGATRNIFIEFLERSCTAEFSGFLLYKELGRRLKKTNPTVAEIFTLMSRDEARHAGFLNKAMSDFGLSLDLGFLTKTRQYTFFKPKFIFYATYLSEKIGYWRYISIYRHLQKNPENDLYPIFSKFENWCQDENRHGDFFAALLKSQPQFLNNWEAKLWSRFFCLSVYVTMYLNDHQRTAFYESVGLDTKQFNQHVILETNRTTARIFPQVIDVENPEFFERLDRMVESNAKLVEMTKAGASTVDKAPVIAAMAGELVKILLMPPVDAGSLDMVENEATLVY